MIRTFFIAWLLLLSTITQAAVNAEVDRTQVGEGESFTLTLSSEDSSTNKPDVSILDANFDVLGTSNSSSMSIINGQMSSRVSWQIQLMPKQLGTIIIPAINIGNEKTQPITIEVTKQSSTPNTAPNTAPNNTSTTNTDSNAFFETTVDKNETYVQSQIVYTQRFYYRAGLPIADISANDLTIDGASIEVLNTKGPRYEQTINGIRYQVIEATYAIFPEKSGQLRIPAQTLAVRMQASMFDQPRQIRLHSNENVINVLPQPSHTNPWLPAKELTLKETWSTTPPLFKVGESITRKITIEAEGLSQSHLPALTETKMDGLKMYADKPEVKNNIAGGAKGIIGVRTESIAIVATKPGTYTLPEINIKWWDTDENTEKTATLAAFTFTVKNNANNNQTALPVPVIDTQANTINSPAPSEAPTTDFKNQLWLFVAGIFLALWILTLALWWRAAHRKVVTLNDSSSVKTNTPKRNPSKSFAFDGLTQACQHNDPIKTREALLTWAMNRWPIDTPSTLDDIAIKEPTLAEALRTLEYALFAKQADRWQGASLLALIKQLPSITAHTKEQKSPLASLYPPS